MSLKTSIAFIAGISLGILVGGLYTRPTGDFNDRNETELGKSRTTKNASTDEQLSKFESINFLESPPGPRRLTSIREKVLQLARENPTKALEYINKLAFNEQKSAYVWLFEEWSKSDPTQAWGWFEKNIENNSFTTDLVGTISRLVASSDRNLVVSALDRLPHEHRIASYRGVFESLQSVAEYDQFKAKVLDLGSDYNSRSIQGYFWKSFAESFPREALEQFVLNDFRSRPFKASMQDSLVRGLVANDPIKALEYSVLLKGDEATKYEDMIIDRWMREGNVFSIASYFGQKENSDILSADVRANIGQRLATARPELAIEISSGLPSNERKIQIVETAIAEISRLSPARAITQIEQLPAASQNDLYTIALLNVTDLEASGKIFNKITTKEAKTAALYGLAISSKHKTMAKGLISSSQFLSQTDREALTQLANK